MPSSHSSVLVSTVRWSMKGRKASLGSRLSGVVWLRTMSACQPRLASTDSTLRFMAALGCSSGHQPPPRMSRYSLSMLYAPPMAMQLCPPSSYTSPSSAKSWFGNSDCTMTSPPKRRALSYPRPAVGRRSWLPWMHSSVIGIDAMYCLSFLSRWPP